MTPTHEGTARATAISDEHAGGSLRHPSWRACQAFVMQRVRAGRLITTPRPFVTSPATLRIGFFRAISAPIASSQPLRWRAEMRPRHRFGPAPSRHKRNPVAGSEVIAHAFDASVGRETLGDDQAHHASPTCLARQGTVNHSAGLWLSASYAQQAAPDLRAAFTSAEWTLRGPSQHIKSL